MLTEEQLTELENMGAVFFSVKECALVLQVDSYELSCAIEREDSPEHAAFHGGRLKSEFEVRQSVLKASKQGSSPAQVLALQLIKQYNVGHA